MTRILLVDDQPLAREALASMLEVHGFVVIPCEHGRQALEEARRGMPDLILSDLLMPVMDGFELCRSLKADPALRSIPLLFHTATYTEPEDETFARSLGAEGVLTKPVDPKVLLAAIRSVVDRGSSAKGREEAPLSEADFQQERSRRLFAKIEHKVRDLEASRLLIDDLFDHSPSLLYIVDREGRFLHLNRKLEVSMRHPREEILGQRRERFIPADIAAAFEANDQQVLASGQPISFEEVGREPDGEHVYFTVKFPLFDEAGQAYAVCGISTDITDRRRLEQDLQRLSDLHRLLYHVNRTIRTAKNERDLFEAACLLCIEQGRFDLAWIGQVPLPGEPLRPEFAAGPLIRYLQGLEIPLDPELPQGAGPSGTCVREGRVVLCKDWTTDPLVDPWRSRAEPYGIRSSATLPITFEGRIGAVLNLYSTQPGFFTPDREELVHELAKDLSFAVDTYIQDRRREAAEQALLEREGEYRAAFEQGAIGMAQLSLEGRFLRVNARFCGLLGCSASELEGRHFREITHPDDQALSANQLQSIQSAPTDCYRFQKRYLRKDGGVLWMEVSGAPVWDRTGNVMYLLSAYEDITERKTSEERILEEQHKLQTLLRTLPDMVWLKDLDGVYRYCNPHFELFFGHPGEAIIGKTDYDFMDPDLAEFFRRHDRLALDKGGPSINEEWVTYASDGHRELLETIKTPMTDATGQVIGVLGIARDITQHRKDQEGLRKLSRAIEQSPLGVAITDLQGTIEFVNPTFTALTGYSREEALGQTARILKSETTPPGVYEAMWAALVRGGTWRGQLQNRRKDGSVFWTALSIAPVLDEEGKPTHYVAFHEDIQARKETEAALVASEGRYRNLFEAMKEGFALHELILDGAGRPADYRFLDVNPAFEEQTGIPREQWVGRTVREVLPSLEFRWVEIYGQVVQTGDAVEFEDHAAPLGRWFHVFAFRPAPGQFATLSHDITERKQAEHALTSQLDELRRWHQVTLDRETRILELKKDINRLCERLGERAQYPSADPTGPEERHP